MSICHVSVPCTDLNASEDLYSAILKPIGYKVYVKTPREVFYRGNVQLQPDLSLRYEKTDKPIGGVRITLFASSMTNVTKFYINGMYDLTHFSAIAIAFTNLLQGPKQTTSTAEPLVTVQMPT